LRCTVWTRGEQFEGQRDGPPRCRPAASCWAKASYLPDLLTVWEDVPERNEFGQDEITA
jgi:hypothetical protein